MNTDALRRTREFKQRTLDEFEAMMGRSSRQEVSGSLEAAITRLLVDIRDAELNVMRHSHFDRDRDFENARDRLGRLNEDRARINALLFLFKNCPLDLDVIFETALDELRTEIASLDDRIAQHAPQQA